MFFFFKQKTAYEMRISDWSSDVCSSDLGRSSCTRRGGRGDFARFHHNITNSAFMAPACFIASNMATRSAGEAPMALTAFTMSARDEIGRESCRERVGRYV